MMYGFIIAIYILKVSFNNHDEFLKLFLDLIGKALDQFYIKQIGHGDKYESDK